MNVNRFTRASKQGKIIVCPLCDSRARVFHFSWSKLSCLDCNHLIDKNDWIIYDKNNNNDISYYDSLLTAGTS